MEKICAFVLVLFLMFSCAYAETRLEFVECGPFSFVCPYGFDLKSTNEGLQTWQNSNGEGFLVMFEKIPEWRSAFSKTSEEALAYVEHVLVTLRRGEINLETICKEKSGGCYKLLCKYENTGFFMFAVCPDGLLSVVTISPDIQLAHDVYRATTYIEYK